MAGNAHGEKSYKDLSTPHRWMLLILVSMGSSVIYGPIYLKTVFYDPLMQALGCTNAELNTLVSIYGIAAVVFYFFSGVIADKIRVRTLSWIGYLGVALLTFYYATLPSYGTLVVVFILYAVFSILIWWGTRYKLVRMICDEEEYSQKIGLSYGIYGGVGLVLSLIQTAVVAAFPDAAAGVTALLIISAVLILICAALAFFFIPKFEGEIVADAKMFDFRAAGQALKIPAVWWAALTMICVYFVYVGASFTTPFMTSVLAAPVVIATVISVVRSYGVSILSAPVFGWVAKKVGSPSKVIVVGMIGAIVCLAALILLPHDPSIIVVVAVLVCLLAFVMNGLYGIASGQLAEAHIPPHLFGTGVGLISIIGLCPDAFMHTWFGVIMDQQGNDAYTTIFLILIAFCVGGMLFAALTLRAGKKNLAKMEAAGEKTE
jgi:MFS family permease